MKLERRGLIGRGAQGVVLLVHDGAQRRLLALKVVSVAGGEAALDRLFEETQPFVSREADPAVPIVEVIREREAPPDVTAALPPRLPGAAERLLIVMWYVHGPTVRELAEGDPSFGPREAAALISAVAGRLGQLHPRLAHLDLKPENLLVNRRGHLFLIDPHFGTLAGTAGYAAPEQLANGRGGPPAEGPGPAADLWALGTLGLFLLAGSFPAPGEEPGRLPEIPEPPSSWTPEERDALRELVRLLRDLRHPEPSARGQIEALAPRLFGLAVRLGGPDLAGRIAASWLRAPLPPRLAPATEALAREPAAGSPTPRASRPTRPLRRALAAGALLSTLGLGGGVAWWLGTSKAAPPRPELVNAAAHRGKAARDGGPKASCDIGSLLLPTQARFLCPDERFDRHRSRWQARFESPDVKEISLRVLNGPDVWRLANPPPGGGVKLELSPNRYDVHVLHANGKSDDDELVLAPGSNESYSAAEYTNQAPARSPAEAAASWRSQWKEAKLAARKDPARVVRIDRTLRDFHAPLQLVPEGPRTAVNVVEATAHGAGRLTWNVNDHPCDGPAMPLAQEPIDPGHPLSLYSDMSLWACPRRASERGPFTVHLAGWREEPIGGVSE